MSLSKHTIAASASIACLILSTSALAAGGPPTFISIGAPISASGFANQSISYTTQNGNQVETKTCKIPTATDSSGNPSQAHECYFTFPKDSKNFKLEYNGENINLPASTPIDSCAGIAVGFKGISQGCASSGGTGCTQIDNIGFIKINTTKCG